jgi:hypothetical protein
VCIGQPARYSGSFIDLSDPDAAQDVAYAASLTMAVSILQPAPRYSGSVIDLYAPLQPAPRYSGSVIDLYAPDAALAVTSVLPAKPVFIRQPAPRYSGSVIDLWSAPDGALALASTLPAKPVFGQSSGVVKENRVLADQNHTLAIIVGQMKSREIEAVHRCRALEESRDRLSLDYDRLYSDYWSQLDVIDDLQARLANNNADLISELQENITSLEEAAEEASCSNWRQSEEIRQLEGIVDCPTLCETSRNCKLCFENCRLDGENRCLSGEVGRLQFQINDMRASHPGMESKMEYPLSTESISCAACVGETAGVDNYETDDNKSLFSSSDDDGSN